MKIRSICSILLSAAFAVLCVACGSSAASTPAQAASDSAASVVAADTLTVDGLPATSYAGEGYTICLPNEGWPAFAAGVWQSDANELVTVSVGSVEGSLSSAISDLQGMGYETASDTVLALADDTVTLTVYLTDADGIVWEVYTSCPADADAEFSTVLQAIAQSFALAD